MLLKVVFRQTLVRLAVVIEVDGSRHFSEVEEGFSNDARLQLDCS